MAMSNDDLQRLLMETFVEEAREQLQSLNGSLLALETGEGGGERGELLDEIFRQAHNLKGASRTVGLEAVERLAHRLETLFAGFRDGRVEPAPERFDVVYRGLDAIAALVEAGSDDTGSLDVDDLARGLEAAAVNGASAPTAPAANDAPEPDQPPPAASAPSARRSTEARQSEDTVRIATAKLDVLMTEVGELVAARSGEEQHTAQLRDLAREVERLEPAEIRSRLDALRRTLEADSRRVSQITGDLQDGLRRARMLPVAAVFDTLPRTARDLARELGKEVSLRIEGGETEVDRSVLEQLRAPLTHLVRNAVDHGIEPPRLREEHGKPPEGSIVVRASQRGGALLVEVSDDGGGLHLDRVRARAVQTGLLSQEGAEGMSDEEVAWLIFRAGFSTRSEVSEVSGRGVGMDVVRGQVERMQGMVDVQSTAAAGTRFLLTLPLSIATTRCLLVTVDGQAFGVPITAVDRIVGVSREGIGRVQGNEAILVDERPMALVRIADALGIAVDPAFEGSRPAVVVGTADRRSAFLVDGLLSAQEVAIRPLPQPLRRVRNLAGVSILGTGEIVPVLNAADLLTAGSRARTALTAPAGAGGTADGAGRAVEPNGAGSEPSAPGRVLVVDDSITTRTLEKNLLEAAGYDVEAASDGMEAWDMLQRAQYALVVSDVQMPRLDGVGLAERVRGDDRLRDLPFVLVTSLGENADRERGIGAGADAYIVKGSFDQDQLLQTVQRLI